mgnify:CR=1 FL=1
MKSKLLPKTAKKIKTIAKNSKENQNYCQKTAKKIKTIANNTK